MEKVWTSVEPARLFVTGPPNPAANSSHLYSQLCRRDVSVLIHGSFELLRHYQSAKHFAMDQRLRLETRGWRFLDFSGNPMPDEQVERQRAEIMGTTLVRCDRVYLFCEDLIRDETGVVDL